MKEIKKYPNPDPNGRPLIDCLACEKRKEHCGKGLCTKCYHKYHRRKRVICKLCGRERPHGALGLCKNCYVRLYYYDTIKKYNAKKYHNLDYNLVKKITKKCVVCGFDKIVDLHHLDGNKKNTNRDNLIGLCPNCHKMVHSYRHYWSIKLKLKKKGYDISKVVPYHYKS